MIQSAEEESVEVFKYDQCKPRRDGTTVACDLGPMPITIGDEPANAYFCNKPVKVGWFGEKYFYNFVSAHIVPTMIDGLLFICLRGYEMFVNYM